MYFIQRLIPDDFLHDRFCLIIQHYHVITVPSHRPAHMQHQFLAKHQIRRDLCRYGFRRMEVSRIHAEDTVLLRHHIVRIKFMGTRNIRLAAQSEQLTFHTVNIVSPVNRLRKNLIQGILQAHPGRYLVDGVILVAVTDPMVRDTGLAQLSAKILPDLPAAFPVLDPEASHPFVTAGQGKSGIRHRMGKISRVKVQANPSLFRIIHPASKMLRLNFIPIHFLALIVQIYCVQCKLCISRDQIQSLIQLLDKLLFALGLAGGVSDRSDPSAQYCVGILEPGQIVDLPAMHTNGHLT